MYEPDRYTLHYSYCRAGRREDAASPQRDPDYIGIPERRLVGAMIGRGLFMSGAVDAAKPRLRSGPSALLGVTLSLLALSVSKGGGHRRTRSGDAAKPHQELFVHSVRDLR